MIKSSGTGVVTMAEDDLYYTGGTIIMDHGQILGAGPTDEFLSENGRLEPKVKMLLGASEEKSPADG